MSSQTRKISISRVLCNAFIVLLLLLVILQFWQTPTMSKLVGPLKVIESFSIAANNTQAMTNGKEKQHPYGTVVTNGEPYGTVVTNGEGQARKVLSNEEGNAWISQRFLEPGPFVVGRLGAAEACLVQQYLDDDAGIIKGCHAPHSSSGIYPETKESFWKFAATYWDALKRLSPRDAMVSFGNIKALEDKQFRKLAIRTTLKNRAIEPFYFANPWSKHLWNKVVLVVHGFVNSIQCQLSRQASFFTNPNVVPNGIHWKFVHMPQCLGKQTPHASWSETLQSVKDDIDQVGSFDVAIVAAGSYAMPLAVYCKERHNASAIAMGGGSQLLFGLKGHRWDTHPVVSKLYNEHWMYPLEVDTPSNSHTIEAGGPYWGSKSQRLATCPVEHARLL